VQQFDGSPTASSPVAIHVHVPVASAAPEQHAPSLPSSLVPGPRHVQSPPESAMPVQQFVALPLSP